MSTKNITSKASTVYPIIVPIKSSLKSVNFYLVKNNDSITLIDAGYDNDECWEALHQVLADNGLSIYDVERIILTHHHIDHIGLVNRILKLINIPVYAHEKSLPRLKRDPSFLASRVEFYEQLYNEMGCGETSTPYIERIKKMAADPDGLIIQGEITLLPDEVAGFNVLETPGHAIDHVVLYDSHQKWLFAGDLLLSETSPNALVEPDEQMNRMPTVVQYRESLKKCAELEADVVFPGHQSLIYNHQELIRKRLNRIDDKAMKLKTFIEQGLTTANDIAKAFYKATYENQFPLVMSEVIGHLDYLESENEIVSRLQSGVRHYTTE